MQGNTDDDGETTDAQTPTKMGEPQTVDTVEEACYGCGVVQEMTIKQQWYENHPPDQYADGECPVCGNDHAVNPPW